MNIGANLDGLRMNRIVLFRSASEAMFDDQFDRGLAFEVGPLGEADLQSAPNRLQNESALPAHNF